jgi:signal transduction histidine kinase
VDLTAFLRDIRAEWRVRLPRLTSIVASGVPDVVADVDVLRRVFDNLLMNALVHAGPDVAVTMGGERTGDLVRITVADDGPGVQGADAERIFDPFVTLSGAGSHRTHGLGLAFCRAALAAMDGTIALRPVERGATFVVELPAAVVLTRQALEQDQ